MNMSCETLNTLLNELYQIMLFIKIKQLSSISIQSIAIEYIM